MKNMMIAGLAILFLSTGANAATEISGAKAKKVFDALQTLEKAKVIQLETFENSAMEGDDEDPDAYDSVYTISLKNRATCSVSSLMSLKKNMPDRYFCSIGK